MYGAPWFMNASEEKKLCCWAVTWPASTPAWNMPGPPAAKNTAGMRMTVAPSMAITWAKSVSTEARKPDHRVYSSTPAATIRMPAPKDSGDSREIRAPPAMKLEVREMTEPSTLEPASMSCDERPCRAYMTSARVWARGATARMRRPNG